MSTFPFLHSFFVRYALYTIRRPKSVLLEEQRPSRLRSSNLFLAFKANVYTSVEARFSELFSSNAFARRFTE